MPYWKTQVKISHLFMSLRAKDSTLAFLARLAFLAFNLSRIMANQTPIRVHPQGCHTIIHSINGVPIKPTASTHYTRAMFSHGLRTSFIVLYRGKKRCFLVQVDSSIIHSGYLLFLGFLYRPNISQGHLKGGSFFI